ncbi:MAG TPA: ABC-F family ATP-binding cassette domain-containing protein [Verrucomicrobia bacterium]|nr:ABC-F family ATP-binding cassette domain-containing protein [Verrucomicrobiota bacterium]HOP95975.1 ABC-F family ATP-binding cassette domain-containing protein [Verrucomicrobiota bacterium]HPU55092.1 ABC-F family ATP-binding cassette domain-containing protein [Verrucomicrobiota bacterium]
MLTLAGITKAYGERVLFADATLQVNRGERIGLVGPNGAGKSTLFSIILGELTPDAGNVTMERGVQLGYLPQESAPVGDETVVELATAVTPEYTRLRRILKAWEADHPVEALHPEDIHDDVHDRFNELGGYRLEAKAKQILAGLGFRGSDFERPAREMSGGWVMRAHLARLLVMEPDLLLLDEPTNHLDLDALLWFQDYLRDYPGAILVISHDREFLNRLVGSIVEIRQSKLLRYTGNYDDYLVQREAHEQQLLAAFKHQEREIARLMEFVNRFRAKNTKAAQAQSKLRQIERMEKIEAPSGAEAKVDFRFPQPQRSGQRVITLQGIHHAYGSNVVYRGMDFQAERGQRMVLVGPNGAGKSTLLKILAGVIVPQAGTRTLGHNVKAGYYSQYRVDMLNPERSVLEEALDTPQRVTEQFVRTLLGCFLFRGDDVFKRVSVLSGGEKSRLALVKLLLDPPNLLLMDEPTTHLDMSSIDALAYALDQFEGTLIFISHDVYFIRALATHVVHVNAGRLTLYPGGYDYYLEKSGAGSARAGLTAGARLAQAPARAAASSSVRDRREQKRLEAEQRQERSRRRRAQKEIVQRLEKEIEELEARQRELTAELENPETYTKPGRAQQINRELLEVQERLPVLTAEWEAQASELEKMN